MQSSTSVQSGSSYIPKVVNPASCSISQETSVGQTSTSLTGGESSVFFSHNSELISSPIPTDLRTLLKSNQKTPWNVSKNLLLRADNELKHIRKTALGCRYCKVKVEPCDDEDQFVRHYFNQQKPLGMRITEIFYIHNPLLISSFVAELAHMEAATQYKHFEPQGEGTDPQRQWVINRWKNLTQQFSDYEVMIDQESEECTPITKTKVVPLWHGTKKERVESIADLGLTYFGKIGIEQAAGLNTDKGYFGSGIYFTDSPRYAAMYSNEDHLLLLALVSCREPYPVISNFPYRSRNLENKPSDVILLEGQPAMKNYNAHFAPVVSTSPAIVRHKEYYPCGQGEEPDWDELVVFREHQVLPQFVVRFGPITEVELKDLMSNEGCIQAAKEGIKPFFEYLAAKASEQEISLLLNSRGTQGETLLHFAAMEGQLAIMQYLVDGMKCTSISPLIPNFLSMKTNNGATPLYAAFMSKNYGAIEWLYQKCPLFIEERTNDGCTLFHLAAHIGYEEGLRFLIKIKSIIKPKEVKKDDIGATFQSGMKRLFGLKSEPKSKEQNIIQSISLESVSKKGWTPIYVAARAGHISILEILKDQPNWKEQLKIDAMDGTSVLDAAAFNNQLETLKWLAKETPQQIEKVWGEGNTLCHSAAIGNARETLEWMKNTYPKLFRNINNCGQTPLHLAATTGAIAVVDLLLDWLHIRDSKGLTPLHIAVIHGQEEMTSFLVTKKAELFALTDDSENTLHLCAKHNQSNILMMLIKNGNRNEIEKAIEQKNQAGYTPLHIAIDKGHVLTIQLLLLAKIHLHSLDDCHEIFSSNVLEHSFDIVDNHGNSLLHLAITAGVNFAIEIIYNRAPQLMEKLNNDGGSLWHSAAAGGHVSVLDWLYTKAPQLLEELNNHGKTPMHIAAGSGHIPALKWFCEKVPKHLSYTTKDGWAPIHEAGFSGQELTVEWLYEQSPLQFTPDTLHFLERSELYPFFIRIQELSTDLKSSPSRNEAINTTLHLHVLSVLWEQQRAKGCLPITITRLYQSFVAELFGWHSRKAAGSLQSLEQPLYTLLGIIGWKGLQNHQFLIPESEIDKSLNKYAEQYKIEISKAQLLASGLIKRDETGRYRFLHPFCQCYLIAQHIHQQTLEKQRQFVIKHRHLLSFQPAISFLAGLVSDSPNSFAKMQEFFSWLHEQPGADLSGEYQAALTLRCLNECTTPNLHESVLEKYQLIKALNELVQTEIYACKPIPNWVVALIKCNPYASEKICPLIAQTLFGSISMINGTYVSIAAMSSLPYLCGIVSSTDLVDKALTGLQSPYPDLFIKAREALLSISDKVKREEVFSILPILRKVIESPGQQETVVKSVLKAVANISRHASAIENAEICKLLLTRADQAFEELGLLFKSVSLEQKREILDLLQMNTYESSAKIFRDITKEVPDSLIPELITLLQQRLHGNNRGVNREVVVGFSNLLALRSQQHQKDICKVLEKLLDHEDLYIRLDAIQTLAREGLLSAGQLKKAKSCSEIALKEKDSILREHAVMAIGRIIEMELKDDLTDYLPLLKGLNNDREKNVRLRSVEALLRMCRRTSKSSLMEIVEVLKLFLQDRDLQVRQKSLSALEIAINKVSPARVLEIIPAITPLLGDKEQSISQSARAILLDKEKNILSVEAGKIIQRAITSLQNSSTQRMERESAISCLGDLVQVALPEQISLMIQLLLATLNEDTLCEKSAGSLVKIARNAVCDQEQVEAITKAIWVKLQEGSGLSSRCLTALTDIVDILPPALLPLILMASKKLSGGKQDLRQIIERLPLHFYLSCLTKPNDPLPEICQNVDPVLLILAEAKRKRISLFIEDRDLIPHLCLAENNQIHQHPISEDQLKFIKTQFVKSSSLSAYISTYCTLPA